jgi:signal transduction histidine kinase
MSQPILSIKLKIVLTFVVAFVVIVGLLITSAYLMRLLQRRVVILEEVSRLEEKVQDLRRCEKNLFLYHDEDCGQRVLSALKDTRRILDANKREFERIFSLEKIDAFSRRLKEYEQAMSAYLKTLVDVGVSVSKDSTGERKKIRDIGARLLAYAESIARQKRHNIRKTISVVNRIQLIQALLAGVGLLIFGGLVLGRVINPLKSLQEHTERIGKGDFREIEAHPQEHEIAEVYKALNRMARDLKKREQDLLRSRHLASLGTLLAGVAHELNNPLSNIRSTCEILLEDTGSVDEEFRRQSLETIIAQVDKAGNIVRDLLELGRGKEFLKEPINLKNLIERTLSLLHGQISPEVEVSVKIAPHETIFADKQTIQQGLMNIITNAVEAIEGEGRIVIEARHEVEGMVDIKILDTGTGIAEEIRNKIFDPFFGTKELGQGTGLGLFITHNIVEKHGGRIFVQSVPGEGTTFVLRMPAKEKPE